MKILIQTQREENSNYPEEKAGGGCPTVPKSSSQPLVECLLEKSDKCRKKDFKGFAIPKGKKKNSLRREEKMQRWKP